MSACRHHIGMTSEELAKQAYLTLIRLDDEWNENTHSEGIHLLGDLWERLMPEFCRVEGCGKARMDSFPWCVDHRPGQPVAEEPEL